MCIHMCVCVILTGILVQRWQIMRKSIIGKPYNISAIISATVVLHNYLMTVNDKTYLPQGTADVIYGQGEAARGNWRVEDVALPQAPFTAARNFPAAAAAARRSFVSHFSNEGAVQWQYDYVNRRPRRL